MYSRFVYDHGPVKNACEEFDEVKARVAREWQATPRLHGPVPEMKNKIKSWCANFDVE
jgi:hypothetical protein